MPRSKYWKKRDARLQFNQSQQRYHSRNPAKNNKNRLTVDMVDISVIYSNMMKDRISENVKHDKEAKEEDNQDQATEKYDESKFEDRKEDDNESNLEDRKEDDNESKFEDRKEDGNGSRCEEGKMETETVQSDVTVKVDGETHGKQEMDGHRVHCLELDNNGNLQIQARQTPGIGKQNSSTVLKFLHTRHAARKVNRTDDQKRRHIPLERKQSSTRTNSLHRRNDRSAKYQSTDQKRIHIPAKDQNAGDQKRRHTPAKDQNTGNYKKKQHSGDKNNPVSPPKPYTIVKGQACTCSHCNHPLGRIVEVLSNNYIHIDTKSERKKFIHTPENYANTESKPMTKPYTAVSQPIPYTAESQLKPYIAESQPKSYTAQSQPKPFTVESQPKPYTVELQPKPYNTESQHKPYPAVSHQKPYTAESQLKPHTTESQPKPYTAESHPKPYTAESQPKPYTAVKGHTRLLGSNVFINIGEVFSNIFVNNTAGVYMNTKSKSQYTKCNKNFKNNTARHIAEPKKFIHIPKNYENVESKSPKVPIRRESRRKPYECKFCDLGFRRFSSLRGQLQIHSTNKRVGSSDCGLCEKFDCASSSKTRIVRRKHHTKKDESKSVKSSDTKQVINHQCTVCQKTCHNTNNLKTHSLTHKGIQPYKCKHCTQTFRHYVDLITHTRVHTSIEHYTCDVCQIKFKHKSSLKNHLNKCSNSSQIPTEVVHEESPQYKFPFFSSSNISHPW